MTTSMMVFVLTTVLLLLPLLSFLSISMGWGVEVVVAMRVSGG
jgi:hypothetical protein